MKKESKKSDDVVEPRGVATAQFGWHRLARAFRELAMAPGAAR
jgi:hypothetical protein